MIKYFEFYRRIGMRMTQNLASPRPVVLRTLPLGMVLHHMPYEMENIHPDLTHPWFREYATKNVLMEFPNRIPDGSPGTYRRLMVNVAQELRPYFRINKKHRYTEDLRATLTDPLQLGVVNYGMLDKCYEYSTMPMNVYHKWHNVNETMWRRIGELSNHTERHHVLMLDLPNILPAFRYFNSFIDQDLTPAALTVFDSPEKMFLLEIFRWLDAGDKLDSDRKVITGAGRTRSLLNHVAVKDLGKVTFIWKTKDGFANVMNLGYLNSWIQHQPNQTDQKRVTSRKPEEVAKLFYRFLMAMYEVTVDKEVVVDDVPSAPTAAGTETKADNPDSVAVNQKPIAPGIYPDGVKQKLESNEELLEIPDIENAGETESHNLDQILNDIDEEIEIVNNQQPAIDLSKVSLEEETDNFEEVVRSFEADPSIEERLQARLDKLVEQNLLSAAQYRKLKSEIVEQGKAEDPYGKFANRRASANVTQQDITIEREKTRLKVSRYVNDPSMAYSSLKSLQDDYNKNVLPRHIVSMIDATQQGGVVIKSHTVERDKTLLGEYEIHTVELQPLEGQASRIVMKVPVPDEDGNFTAGGNHYVLRTQRIDLPIRKIDGDTVGLTSYYGKTFVARSGRATDSSSRWIIKQIMARNQEEKPLVTKLSPGNAFDSNFDAPYLYSTLAEHYRSFMIKQNMFMFGRREVEKLGFELDKIEKGGSRVCGHTPAKEPIVIHIDNSFTVLRNGVHEPIGNIYDLLQLEEQKAPLDYAEMRIFSNTIPLGIVLGYYIGLNNLLRLLKAEHRWVEGRRVGELTKHQYAIRFSDGFLVLSRRQRTASLILAGLASVEKVTKQFSRKEFNKPAVYFNVLQGMKLSAIYLKEMDCLNDMFVDPITKSVLEAMGEPVTFKGLLVRATEMLDKYTHPVSQDVNYQRFRGYERIAGAMYRQMTKAIRQQRMSNIPGRTKVNMSPFDVWQSILQDQSSKGVENINPIQNLKEREVVTYVGVGGRDKGSMNKASRAFTESDFGISSEASVDSSDVGINTFMSTDPSFKNMLGMPDPNRRDGPASLLSTASMLAPGATQDDAKRAVFIGVQAGHMVAAKGYRQLPIRTGYDTVPALRVGSMFAATAKQDGKVISLNDKGMVIELADGTKQGVKLGQHFGRAEGSIYPHTLVPNVKLGDKVTAGQVLAYNSSFFEPDALDPTAVAMRRARLVNVMFVEEAASHEDSCSISQALADDFHVTNSKMESVVVRFNQRIHMRVKEGQDVNPGDALAVIEDETTSNTDMFDEDSLRVLQDMALDIPRTKIQGRVERIEVIYNGEKDEMSASVRKLADASDRFMTESCRARAEKVVIGSVDEDYRVSGKTLMRGEAEIRIYITQDLKMGVADKGVLGNQLKCTVGEVMPYELRTESGDLVDVKFSFRSVSNRIVNSTLLIGTTSTLLEGGGMIAYNIYRGNK